MPTIAQRSGRGRQGQRRPVRDRPGAWPGLLVALLVPTALGGLLEALAVSAGSGGSGGLLYYAGVAVASVVLLGRAGCRRALRVDRRVLGMAALLALTRAGLWVVLAAGVAPGAPPAGAGLVALLLAGAPVLAAVAEELQLRGLVQPAVARRWGLWPSVAVSAGVFALLHLVFAPSYLVPVFLADGILLAVLRGVSGSVAPSLVVHGALNLAVVLVPVAADVPDHVVAVYVVAVLVVDATCVLGVLRRGRP